MSKYITVVGYPRSGTTWLARLILDLTQATTGAYVAPGPRLVPDHFRKNLRGPNKNICVLRTHNTVEEQYPRDMFPWDFTIFIVRDIRDIVVSFKHYKNISSYELAYDILQQRCNWSEYVENWWRNADVKINYENLLENPKKILQEICERIPYSYGVYSGVRCETVLNNSSLNEMKALYSNMVFKGKAGSHKEVLSVELIERITQDHKQILGELKYE